MNKIYSLVWNRSRNQIEVASELARSHGGNTGRGAAIGAPPALKGLASAILLSGSLGLAGQAWAQTANCTYTTTSTGTILCGYNAAATGNGAVAIGDSAISYGNQSTALGGGAQAGTSGGTTNQSIALGAFAGATGDQSTALGNNAQAAGNSSIAIGGDDLDKVAQATYTATINGTSETKTGAALFTDLTGSTAIASGTYHSPAAGDGSVALGPQAMAGGSFTGATPSGTFTQNGVFDVAIGAQAQASGFSSIALGTGASATADTSFAIGPNARASAPVTIAFGVSALANKTNAVAIGTGGTSATTYTQATGTGATAIGGNATAGANASGSDAIAIGGQSVSSGISATAIGRGATASNQNDVALGSGSITAAPHTGSLTVISGGTTPAGVPVAANGVLSVGSAGKERQVQNVAAGAISQTSTDAVNGSQLYAVGSQVNTNTANIAANTAAITSTTADLDSLGASVATALGAGTTYSSTTGTISGFSQPINTVSATGAVSGPVNQTTVGAALTQLNTNVDNTANIAVKYDAIGANKITLGATGGTGAPAGGVTVTNLKAGNIAATSTDAVNGSQLYATNQNVAANTSAIATNSGDITALQQNALQWNPALNGGTGAYDASYGGSAQVVTNVAGGAVNATSTDAVNGSQLYATNQNVAANTSAIATNSGDISALQTDALQWNSTLGTYDASHGSGNPQRIGNVADATQAHDAVNLEQLQSTVGTATADAVTYDDATHASVTLGGTGATSPVALTNIQAGTLNSTSTDAVNGSQLYATNQNVAANATAITTTTTNLDNVGNSTATALGGGASYDASTGTVSAPSYDVYGNSDSNVGQAISDLQTKAPVQYSDASGTPTPLVPSNDVALVGAGAGPVALHNVASGVVGASSTDAVNGSQLYAVQQTAGAGWNVSANGGTAVNVAPGATLDISAGPSGNVAVTQSGTSLTIDASENPNFTTVTTSGDITAAGVLNANGGLIVASGQAVDMGGNTVSNIGAGTLSATSTDAVNGSQLYATNQNVATNAATLQALGTGMAAGLGGASSYDPLTGTLTTSIEYDGNSYGSVQSVFDQISGAVNGGAGIKYFHVSSTGADSQALGTDSVAIGADAVATTAGDVALGSGSTTAAANPTSGVTLWGSAYTFAGGTPTSVVSVGSVGSERQVTNVAAGQLNATSTDAVNGSQLYATNRAVNSLGTQVNTNTSNISNLQGQINTINQNGAGMFQVSKDLNNQPMPTPTGTNSAAGGAGASASGTNSLAMGNGSNASGDQSTAVGTSSVASGTASTAIGQGAEASGNNSVAIGTGSVATDDNTVSVGSADNLRKITNVAAGTAPTDAATVGQLQATQKGGVQYDSHADGSTDYTNVTMDQGGAPATVHNVAAGSAANDAVNVGQLNAGISTAENWAQTYTDQRFNQLQGDLSQLGNRANAGIASAIAAANLPQPYAPNQSALSVGLGTFRGETGMAVGLSKITESGRYILKANASSDTRGDLGAGVGAAVVW